MAAPALAEVLLRVRGGRGLVLKLVDILGNGILGATNGNSGRMFCFIGDTSVSGASVAGVIAALSLTTPEEYYPLRCWCLYAVGPPSVLAWEA